MQAHFKSLFIVALVVLFASCKKSNTQGRFIPSNASIAIQVDGEAISKKLPWAAIKDNPVFTQAYADSNLPETFKKLMDNPETSGIDVKKDLLFFVQKDSLGGYIAFEGSVKDEAVFKNFNNSFPEKGSASEADGISFISRMPVCVGWNKERFVYVFDAPQMGQMDGLSRRMMKDSIDITNHSSRPRDIAATCKAVFALEKSSSLADEEKFTTMLAEPGDIHVWLNTEELNKSANTSPIAMVTLDKLISGSVTTAAISFNDGKININTLSYSGDDITKLFKKYSGGKINDAMLQRIPGKDIFGAMALNFKPEAVRELLQVLGFDGIVNTGLTKMGASMNDFVKANKGDIVLGLSDLKMVTDTTGGNEMLPEGNTAPVKPAFNFLFATSVADKESFNKIVTAAKSLSNSFGADAGDSLAYNSNNEYFTLGNSKEQADEYLAGGSNNADWIAKINGEPFGAYLNFQTIIKSFEQQAGKDSSTKIAYDASLRFWNNVLWKGGHFKNGGLAQDIEINLMDKSTNSLLQINTYAAKLGAAREVMIKKQREDIMAFEDAVIPSATKDSTVKSSRKTK